MKYASILFCLIIMGCKTYKTKPDYQNLSIAFGSCNHQNKPNQLWQPILDSGAELWIWGGDNIYADTEDMQKMQADYFTVKSNPLYQKLEQRMQVLGTWDDHDYGKNDAGYEYPKKQEAQQLLLDFLSVPAQDPRRKREGVYYKYPIVKGNYSAEVLLLDTRSFRTVLNKAPRSSGKRYQPNADGQGTILGEAQWKWLEQNIKNSSADVLILVSSIQVLSQEHGFETWGNFPHERQRLLALLAKHQKPVLILSGDRHISEFSEVKLPEASYPLVDFTSSGLTHAYRNFTDDPNTFRSGEVVSTESFGWLNVDFKLKKITLQMRGENGVILQEKIFDYARP
ncbi:MAG: alkaline phosphatase D family protein [Flavobacteriaceae bacterium]|nr:alkaline phosphatase D family protein [Flavobacteriaceae bacterium]